MWSLASSAAASLPCRAHREVAVPKKGEPKGVAKAMDGAAEGIAAERAGGECGPGI